VAYRYDVKREIISESIVKCILNNRGNLHKNPSCLLLISIASTEKRP